MAIHTMQQPREEQALPRFAEKRYYPVNPQQLLADRYLTIAKLGYGANSTVWLARDKRLVSSQGIAVHRS